MKVTILGSGTSHGVPMIGCDCTICTSSSPKNRRQRPSVLVSHRGQNLLVDASIDFRAQAIQAGLKELDAVLFTHHHADHILGIDDLRTFTRLTPKLPCYSNRLTLDRLRHCFDYAFEDGETEQSRPSLQPREVNGPFELGQISVRPFDLLHGSLPILGFLFTDAAGHRFAYATDCSEMPDATKALVKGVDLLVLDALRYRPHPTHLSLDQAVELARELQPRQTLFTHIAHNMDHQTVNRELPPEIQLSYDGQVIDFDAVE